MTEISLKEIKAKFKREMDLKNFGKAARILVYYATSKMDANVFVEGFKKYIEKKDKKENE